MILGVSWQISLVGFFFFNTGYEETMRKISELSLLDSICVFGLLAFFTAQLFIECHVRGLLNLDKQSKEVLLNDKEGIEKTK